MSDTMIRNCAGCSHYVVKDVRLNYSSSSCGTEEQKIYGCELWECEQDKEEDNK